MEVLRTLKEGGMRTKSGIMLGLGEMKEEVIQSMHDLRNSGVDVITIGQYLQPTKNICPLYVLFILMNLLNTVSSDILSVLIMLKVVHWYVHPIIVINM